MDFIFKAIEGFLDYLIENFGFNATFLVFLASYLVFIPLLNLTLWKPLRKLKADRQSDLEEEILSASLAETKTKTIINEINSQIQSFKQKERADLDEAIHFHQQKQKEQEQSLKRSLEEYKKSQIDQINQEKTQIDLRLESYAEESASQIINRILNGRRSDAIA
ncbi:MAG: hypothetical protein SFT81_03975 [Candidatus Caenarcaniphilales bacterium]|nr:hypothetical protein [Candidatus Caenarcaniphilales bacterium]